MTERAWFPLTLLVLSNVLMAHLLCATLRAAMACGHSVALRSCFGLMTFFGRVSAIDRVEGPNS